MGYKLQDSTTENNATLNSSSAANTAVTAYAWGYQTALVTFTVTGTVSAGALTAEGWDGYNWYGLPTTPGSTTTTLQSTIAITSSGYAFANINCFSKFRARLSTAITGTGSVFVNVNLSAGSEHTP